MGEAPEVHALADGTLAIAGDGVLVRTDASMHVVRRVIIPHLSSRSLVATDGAWERVVTAQAYTDTRTGEQRTLTGSGSTYVACDRDVLRCIRLERVARSALVAHVEEMRTGVETAAFEVNPERARLDERALADVSPTYGLGQILGERAVLVLARFHGPSVLVVYDLATRVPVAAKRIARGRARATWADAEGTRLLLEEERAVSVLDARDPRLGVVATARGEVVASVADRLLIGDREERVHSRATLEEIPTAPEDGERLVLGTGGIAYVGEARVRFVDALGASRGVADIEDTDEDLRERAWASTPSGIVSFPQFGVLERVRPGADARERFTVANEEGFETVAVRGGEIFVVEGEGETSFGPRGIRRALVAADEEPVHDPLDDRPGATGRASPARRGGVFAYVERGTAHLTDAEGRDVATPVRLPRDVDRSGCGYMVFVADEDVALAGSAPCIPTRVRFRRGTTEPLGRAYVSVAETPDGARVALMADRRILVLDGRTGETVREVRPELASPRGIALSDDGAFVALRGTENAVLVDVRGAEARVVRFEGTYVFLMGDGTVVRCEGPTLHVHRAFGEAIGAASESESCKGRLLPDVAEVPGFAVMGLDVPGSGLRPDLPSFEVVRLRDGARLGVEVLRGRDEDVAFVLTVRGAVQAVDPPGTPLVRFVQEDGEVTALPGEDGASALVRAFFAGAEPD